MKLIGYVRVSTKKQADEGVSLSAQKKKLEQYCELYEHKLVKIIVDAGESAKSLKRDGVQEALQVLKEGKAEGLLVAKLDRLTRSIVDLCNLIDKYFTENFSLISVSENLDTKSAAGRLVLNVLMAVSQWEREAIGERTSAALQYKKSKGEYTGGVVPYGFALDSEKKLVPIQREQEMIRIAKKLRDSGYSLRKISSNLAKNGYFSKTGRIFNPKTISQMVS